MKTFRICLAVLIALVIAGVGISLVASSQPVGKKLSTEQVAKYRALLGPYEAAVQSVDRAELVLYRAKDAAQKALDKANVEFAALQKEGKCEGCGVDPAELAWIHPPEPSKSIKR